MRDLRNHGREVIDRVMSGERLTVTRLGRPVAELRPLPKPGPYVAALLARWQHPAPCRRARHAARSRRNHRLSPVSDVAPAQRGVLDTKTLAELSVGPLLAATEAERAAELTHVQQAEADFEPIAFDAAAARVRTRGSGPAAGRTQTGRTWLRCPGRRHGNRQRTATLHRGPGRLSGHYQPDGGPDTTPRRAAAGLRR